MNRSKNTRINRFYNRCRDAGLSVTPQRLAVYNALVGSDNHPSPEMIYKHVQAEHPMISFATVYKILEALEQKGIIAKVTTLNKTLRYDPLIYQHHHIICIKCKKIIDLESSELDALPVPPQVKSKHKLIDYSVHFNVICSDCRKKE